MNSRSSIETATADHPPAATATAPSQARPSHPHQQSAKRLCDVSNVAEFVAVFNSLEAKDETARRAMIEVAHELVSAFSTQPMESAYELALLAPLRDKTITRRIVNALLVRIGDSVVDSNEILMSALATVLVSCDVSKLSHDDFARICDATQLKLKDISQLSILSVVVSSKDTDSAKQAQQDAATKHQIILTRLRVMAALFGVMADAKAQTMTGEMIDSISPCIRTFESNANLEVACCGRFTRAALHRIRARSSTLHVIGHSTLYALEFAGILFRVYSKWDPSKLQDAVDIVTGAVTAVQNGALESVFSSVSSVKEAAGAIASGVSDILKTYQSFSSPVTSLFQQYEGFAKLVQDNHRDVSWYDYARWGRAIMHSANPTEITQFLSQHPPTTIKDGKQQVDAALLLYLELKASFPDPTVAAHPKLLAGIKSAMDMLERNFLSSHFRKLHILPPLKSYAQSYKLFRKVYKKSVAYKLQVARSKMTADCITYKDLSLTPTLERIHVPLNCTFPSLSQSDTTMTVEAAVDGFLSEPSKRVLVLVGAPGCGKSFTLQRLFARFWSEFDDDKRIPILIPLGSAVDLHLPTLLDEALRDMGFDANDASELKTTRRFLIMLDGYDQLRCLQTLNLFESNHWSALNEVNVIITTRPLNVDALSTFAPLKRDYPQREHLEIKHILPFTDTQCSEYIVKFAHAFDASVSTRKSVRCDCISPALPSSSHTATYYADLTFELVQQRAGPLRDLLHLPQALKIVLEVLPKVHSQAVDILEQAPLVTFAFMERWFHRHIYSKGFSWPTQRPHSIASWNCQSFCASCLQLCQALAAALPVDLRAAACAASPQLTEDLSHMELVDVLLPACPIVSCAQGYVFLSPSIAEYFRSLPVASNSKFQVLPNFTFLHIAQPLPQTQGDSPSKSTFENGSSHRPNLSKSPPQIVLKNLNITSIAELVATMQTVISETGSSDIKAEPRLTLLYQFSLEIINTFEASLSSVALIDIIEIAQLASLPDQRLFSRVFDCLVNAAADEQLSRVMFLQGLGVLVAIADEEFFTTINLIQTMNMMLALVAPKKPRDDRDLYRLLSSFALLLDRVGDLSIQIGGDSDIYVMRVVSALKQIKSSHPQVIAAVQYVWQALLHLKRTRNTKARVARKAKLILSGVGSIVSSVSNFSAIGVWDGIQHVAVALESQGNAKAWFEHFGLVQEVCQAIITAPSDGELRLCLGYLNDLMAVRGECEGAGDVVPVYAFHLDAYILRSGRDADLQRYFFHQLLSLPGMLAYVVAKERFQSLSTHAQVNLQPLLDLATPASVKVELSFPYFPPPQSFSKLTNFVFRRAAHSSLIWKLASLHSHTGEASSLNIESSMHIDAECARVEANGSYAFAGGLSNVLSDFTISKQSTLLLLGPPASGKSLAVKLFAKRLWAANVAPIVASTAHQTYDQLDTLPFLPLVISLTGVFSTSRTIVEDALHGLGWTAGQIADLKDSPIRLLLIFDGYDSMLVEDGSFSSSHVANLIDSNDLESWNAKFIFTCRTHHLRSLDLIEDVFAPAHAGLLSCFTVLPFESPQIDAFVRRSIAHMPQLQSLRDCLGLSDSLLLDLLVAIGSSTELMSAPFTMRSMIEESADAILRNLKLSSSSSDDTQPQSLETVMAQIDLDRVRDELVASVCTHWFERQYNKLVRASKSTKGSLTVDSLVAYASQLAAYLLRSQRTSFTLADASTDDELGSIIQAFHPLGYSMLMACPLHANANGHERQSPLTMRFIAGTLQHHLASRCEFDGERKAGRALSAEDGSRFYCNRLILDGEGDNEHATAAATDACQNPSEVSTPRGTMIDSMCKPFAASSTADTSRAASAKRTSSISRACVLM